MIVRQGRIAADTAGEATIRRNLAQRQQAEQALTNGADVLVVIPIDGEAAADRFGRMNPDALIVSKADEAALMALPLTLAMSINVMLVNGAVFVPGLWDYVEYRALEGFVFAVTPFNFTSIAGNLPTAPAMMGNVVIWKPARSQVYSAHVIMELFKAAGLPDGVINMVTGSSSTITDVLLNHKDFSGVHFTGSTPVFYSFWETIGKNVNHYRSYPRIVGETGGKDFIWAHPSADAQEVATAISRGAFEYQGQKCPAASRAYLPKSLWADIRDSVINDIK